MTQTHGTPPRGLDLAPQSVLLDGRFGRLFRNLPSFEPSDEAIDALAATMLEPPDTERGGEGDGSGAGGYPPPPARPQDDPFDNPTIPAGFTYLGQFIDHDITFDPVSSLQRKNDPDALRDFRTPRFDLDSVYGGGPSDAPFLYQRGDGTKLLVGQNDDGEMDLPRNLEDRALIGDPRNDENTIVSQLQLLFLRFHNKVVDDLVADGWPQGDEETFDEAQRTVRWHYQWIVVHDFLSHVMGANVVDDIIGDESYVPGGGTAASRKIVTLLFYRWQRNPFMPVEFSVAAYRFGHSMIRPDYFLNATLGTEFPIFVPDPNPAPTDDLRGFKKLPNGWTIDWSFFFDLGTDHLQHARRIDTKLAEPLRQLPGVGDPASLAVRNLRRGSRLGLPSGQRVARAMGLEPIGEQDLGIGGASDEFVDRAPLWFYVLKEAELTQAGERLGPIGGRIVAEVLCGLLKGDPLAYINVEPNWTPTLPGTEGDFTMADLVRYVMS